MKPACAGFRACATQWLRSAHSPERRALASENAAFSFEIRQLLYGRRQHRHRILFTIEGDAVSVLHIATGAASLFPRIDSKWLATQAKYSAILAAYA